MSNSRIGQITLIREVEEAKTEAQKPDRQIRKKERIEVGKKEGKSVTNK